MSEASSWVAFEVSSEAVAFGRVEDDRGLILIGVHMCTPTGGEGRKTHSLFGSCFFSKVKKRKKKQRQ